MCDWGSPLVFIPKPDKKVGLCVDYKIAVNPQLESAHYPNRRIDDILNNLRNSTYLCRLDLYKAYLHVQVDDETKRIQAISTHRGIYKINRLSFGIKTAPSEYNRILEKKIIKSRRNDTILRRHCCSWFITRRMTRKTDKMFRTFTTT